ncbi:MAG TPA: hypothetical protein VN706_21225 [Gemmatimonadaceae bacterium]|nr:hypothetical protein [Gemmatimonadaceae bacterium]
MAEPAQRWLGIATAAVLVVSFVAWRSVRPPSASGPGRFAVPAPVPSPQLAQLMPYAAPLADSVRIAPAPADSIVVRRDPFGDVIVPTPVVRRHTVVAGPVTQQSEGTLWDVTATLTSGTRRAAVINDALIYVGDPLPGGGKLTSVERDRVVVTDAQGKPHTVAVKEDNG